MLLTTLTANIASDVYQLHLYPKTFTTVLRAGGVRGDVQIQVSPNGTDGWDDLLTTPLTVSAGILSDSITSLDTMHYFKCIPSSFSANDITDVYVSGVD